MNSFDRNSAKVLRSDIENALIAVGAKHGIILSLGNCRFSSNEVKFTNLTIIPKTYTPKQVNLGPQNIGGVTDPFNTLESREYLNIGYQLGLPKAALGEYITVAGRRMRITGLKMSRRKYPVNIQGPDGGRYKLDAARTKAELAKLGYKI